MVTIGIKKKAHGGDRRILIENVSFKIDGIEILSKTAIRFNELDGLNKSF